MKKTNSKEKPLIYWQVGDGPKHEIPEGAVVYVWDPMQKAYHTTKYPPLELGRNIDLFN